MNTLVSSVFFGILLGQLSRDIAEGLQQLVDFLDRRGRLIKRVGVYAVALILTLVLSGLVWILRELGVPIEQIQGELIAPLAVAFAYWFHQQDRAKET